MKTNENGNGRHLESVWLSGSEEIAAVVGVDRRDIADLVRRDGLPAFKWRGRWRILPEDAAKWSRTMAKKYRRTRAGPGKAPTGRQAKSII